MSSDMAQIMARLDTMQGDVTGLKDRVEKFTEAMIQLARTEERMAVVLENLSVLFHKVDKLEGRMSKAESTNATQSQSLGFFERFGWLVATAIAGVIGWMFRG